MSLRLKFLVLLLFALATVVVALGSAAWSVRVLERELDEPWVGVQRSLAALGRIKRAVGAQHNLVRTDDLAAIGPRTDAGGNAEPMEREGVVHERFASHARTVRDSLVTLEGVREFGWLAGESTARNLAARIAHAYAAADRWFEAPGIPEGAQSLEEVRRGLFGLHELIERVEGQMVENAALRIDHGRDLRAQVLLALAVSMLAVVLAGALAAILVRRWVLAPVAHLRLAAGEIASGNFDYRVPVSGHDEIAALTAEVNHMAGMVGELQRERIERERLAAIGEMVRRLAHNLRNPLAGIRALAQASLADAPDGTELRSMQTRIIATVDRFEGWLRDLLRSTQPLELRVQPGSPAEWAANVLSSLEPMAEARHVRLDLDTAHAPARAAFDPGQLEQALVAVVTNAVQASAPGQQVQVRVTSENGGWRVVVRDEGPGVSEHLRRSIFSPHFTTKPDGTGIGLAMAKRIVEQHGGSIEVAAGTEVAHQPPGAVFTVDLPIHAGG
jgi:signal transduction histidine kinase